MGEDNVESLKAKPDKFWEETDTAQSESKMTVKRKFVKQQHTHIFLKKAWQRVGEGILLKRVEKNQCSLCILRGITHGYEQVAF